MRNKIIEILKEHEGWVDRSRTDTCVWPDDYGDVADEIVKLFSMSNVVGALAEQLPEQLCKNNPNFKCNCIDQDRCPNFPPY